MGSETLRGVGETWSDPLAELDRKYPGFKKGNGYLKLESQSRQLAAKTSLLTKTFTVNLNSLRDQMQETASLIESHKNV